MASNWLCFSFTQVEFFLPKTNFWRSVSCLCLHHILPPVKVHIMASSRKGNFNSSLQKRYKARWRLGYSSSMQLTPNYHALLWAWRRKLLAVEKKMMKMWILPRPSFMPLTVALSFEVGLAILHKPRATTHHTTPISQQNGWSNLVLHFIIA